MNERPPHPREANPGVPADLDDLVVRLLGKGPEDRFRNAGELAEVLERLRDRPRPTAPPGASGPTSPAVPSPTPPTPRGSRRRGGAARALAVLVAVLALLAVAGLALRDGAAEGTALGGVSDGAREALGGIGRTLFGPEMVEVPGVEGLPEREARGRLEAANLGSEVRPRDSSEKNAGRVLEQSVPGGDEVEKGSKVLLAVGEGPRNEGASDGASDGGEVPDVVGLSYPEAERALEGAGFALGGVEEAPSASAPAGVILGQDPSAGSAATPGTPVFLKTSTGGAGAPTSAPASAPASSSASAPASAPASASAAPR